MSQQDIIGRRNGWIDSQGLLNNVHPVHKIPCRICSNGWPDGVLNILGADLLFSNCDEEAIRNAAFRVHCSIGCTLHSDRGAME
jgi:hypothetical protein